MAGRLQLRVGVEHGCVRRVRVENGRPLAAHLLNGRRVDEAVTLASNLFSLCGQAQGLAARLAVDAAQGLAPSAPRSRHRATLVELAQEHLWRLMIDWPQRLGMTDRREAFADLHRRLAGAAEAPETAVAGLRALVAESGFAVDAAMDTAALRDACRRGGPLGEVLARLIDAAPVAVECTALLPQVGAGAWSARLTDGMPDAAFCRQPVFDDAPAETGALARQAKVPVVASLLAAGRRCAARVVARVVELARVASVLADPAAGPVADAASASAGVGLACVETARGLLMHGVRVEAGVVTDYRIVAPTEWNFHPAGVFFRETLGLKATGDDAARSQVQCLALALDPCVAWDVADLEGEEAIRA